MFLYDDLAQSELDHSFDDYCFMGHRIWITVVSWTGDPLEGRIMLRQWTKLATAYLRAYGIQADLRVGANHICTRPEDDNEAVRLLGAFAEMTPPQLAFRFAS